MFSIELLLHLVGDGHELGVDAVADGVEALRSLLIEALKLRFQLLRSEHE